MAKKGTKIGDYTRPRLNKIIDQRVAAEISEGAGVDTTGTPADNQIAIFTDSNTLEGSANLTYDGTTINLDDTVVINESGADNDFRIESDNEPYMFFVDGGNNRILIGSGSTFTDAGPTVAATLEVQNNASAGAYNVPLVRLRNNDTDQRTLEVVSTGGTADTVFISSMNMASKAISINNSGLADHAAIADQTHALVSIASTNRRTSPFLELLKSHENDTAPVLSFKDDSEAPADDRGIGVMQWIGWDSNDQDTLYAQISGSMSDFTHGDEGGKIAFEVSAGGTGGTAALAELLTIGGEDVANGTPCAVIINEAGIDCDFRIEGDTETHLLFVDAGNERVSIGDSVDAPAATLEITNNNSAGAFNVPLLQLNNNDADQVALDINAGNTTANVIDIVADTLTTGAIINIVSDSSAANDRTLVKIHNDNTAAVGTKMLHIINDAVGATNDPLVIIESTAAETEFLLELRNSNAATDKPPVLCFNRSDTSAEADDMEIGTILFEASAAGAVASTAFARIAAKATDITVRDIAGLIDFEVMAGGTAGISDMHKLLSIGGEDVANSTPCEVVINEAGIDCDFRVESDGNTNMFFVDGGRNIVTVGADLNGGQLAGFAVVNDYNTSTFESLLGANGRYGSVEILRYSPGADDTLTAGQVYFLHTDGTWDAADADAVATGGSQLLCLGLGGSARTVGVIIKGYMRVAASEILNTPGSGAVDGLPLYVSTTAGHLDFTAPSASGDFVRIVGYAIDDDSGDILVYFNPDSTFVEIA